MKFISIGSSPFHSTNPQVFCNSNSAREEFMLKILNRRWTLMNPDAKVHQIKVSTLKTQQHCDSLGKFSFANNPHPSLGENVTKWNNVKSSFYIVRDDLLHPLVNGNKARKLDALLPLVEDHLGTDVVTCGGCQSAHAAAVDHVQHSNSKKIVIVNEGAGDAIALPGLIRLVKYLSQDHIFGKIQPLKIVVDAGTGTTAVGLGIGALCLGLPWEVTAVMLADTREGYRKQEECLISELCQCFDLPITHTGLVNWVERQLPRKFGNVLRGEIEACQQIAQETGVLVDPIYTLAAWELATQLIQE